VMELIYGNEERAIHFLKDIAEKDRVAIFSHTDVDGFVAGRVMHEAVPAEIIQFLDYSPSLVANLITLIEEKKINKVIFTDLNLEQNRDDIRELSKRADILIIDHHEYSEDLNSDAVTFIKTPSTACAAYVAYQLLRKISGSSIEKLDWLVGAAVIADYTFESNKEFIRTLEKKYLCSNQAQTNSQAFQSDLGLLAIKINNATIYFDENLEKFYQIFKKIEKREDLQILETYASKVQKEVDKSLNNFQKFHEKKGDMLFYLAQVKYGITSIISTVLSSKYPHNTLIFLADSGKEYIKISSRRQDGKVNLPELLKKSTSGLKEATSGGHVKAAGGSIKREDLEEFKKRLFSLIRKSQKTPLFNAEMNGVAFCDFKVIRL